MIICKYLNVTFGLSYVESKPRSERYKVMWVKLYDGTDAEFYKDYKEFHSDMYIHSEKEEIPINFILALNESEEFKIFKRDYDLGMLLG